MLPELIDKFKTRPSESNRRRLFEALVDQYSEKLYHRIRYFLKNHNDTDDALQETFVKIWKNLHRYRGNSHIYTWIYRIATNEALKFLTDKSAQFQKKQVDIDLKTMLGTHDDGQSLRAEDLEKLLEQAIASLPARQKEVFVLRYFREMPYDEMADHLQTSAGSLKASYHHAYEKVKKFLLLKYDD